MDGCWKTEIIQFRPRYLGTSEGVKSRKRRRNGGTEGETEWGGGGESTCVLSGPLGNLGESNTKINFCISTSAVRIVVVTETYDKRIANRAQRQVYFALSARQHRRHQQGLRRLEFKPHSGETQRGAEATNTVLYCIEAAQDDTLAYRCFGPATQRRWC